MKHMVYVVTIKGAHRYFKNMTEARAWANTEMGKATERGEDLGDVLIRGIEIAEATA